MVGVVGLRVIDTTSFEISSLIMYAICGLTEKIRGFSPFSFFFEIAPLTT